jgi:UDPglucose 6-dehydrogenase
MRIAVFGSGYVGLVTANCFAELGNQVCCVDIDPAKVASLTRGVCPIYEPGLEKLLQENLKAGRVTFTTEPESAISQAEIIFIAVGTPPQPDGSVDMQYVESVAKTIGKYLGNKNSDAYTVIVNKSTVPVGTADTVKNLILEALPQNKNLNFSVVSNPEFLKEGSAVQDFMRADRIVIGVDSDRASRLMRALYAPINRNRDKLMVMDIRSAELTKYAANAMLATKISFMNEMSRIAEAVNADIEQVRLGMGADHRIGYDFTHPGCGYGGSCFPKDVLAAKFIAESRGEEAKILKAVHEVNESQKARLLKKIDHHYSEYLKLNSGVRGKTFALWGLAFKPNTDDIRSASSKVMIEGLLARGAKIQAYDPKANTAIAHEYPEFVKPGAGLMLCPSAQDACVNADALIVVTEWLEFRSPDFLKLQACLKDQVIFDGRNLYDPAYLKSIGLKYYSIGRQAT